MKRFLKIVLIGILSFGVFSSFITLRPIQVECFSNFVGCMNDAEVEYFATVGTIQGSEKLAGKYYVAAVRKCLSSYNDCPKE